jgi:8-oxo-dGTP pyrophosphatase MutT (NUDIX family)
VADTKLRPASTVVVLRDTVDGPEVFMVRRHHGNEFMAGAYVFPGGRVDRGDRDVVSAAWCDGFGDLSARMPGMSLSEAEAFLVAAARELFEEAGVLVARDAGGRFVSLTGDNAEMHVETLRHAVHSGARAFPDVVREAGLRLALDALVPFAHWVTPPLDIRRFDTRFFLAPMPAGQRPAHDEKETTESMWIRPTDAIGRCERGDIVLPPPTWTSLRELEPFTSVAAALAWAAGRRVVGREPKVTEISGEHVVLLPGDPLFPGEWAETPPLETRFVKSGGSWRAIQSAHGSRGSRGSQGS